MFKQQDKAIVKEDSKDYTGKYAGTEVTVVKVDTDKYVTVESSIDQYNFMCPISYLITMDDYLNPPECDCGGKNTSTNHHYKWCDLLRNKR